MTRKIIGILVSLTFIVSFCSCNSGGSSNNTSTSPDEATIAKGQTVFTQYCSGCHGFRQDGIGPRLNGITQDTSRGWISNFIKEPQKVIESGDARAQRLFKKYHVIMPSFAHLSGEDMDALIAFLNTKKGGDKKVKQIKTLSPILFPIPCNFQILWLI